jgi:hypothetical protein
MIRLSAGKVSQLLASHVKRLCAVLACAGLSACGGGGDSSLDILKVNVTDSFGARINGALVQGSQGIGMTDAQGVAFLLVDTGDNPVELTVSREAFLEKTVAAQLTGQNSEVTVTLERATSPAGGSLTSRSGTMPTAGADGSTLTFEVELVVVDGDSQPILNLSASDFALLDCAPDPRTARSDCVSSDVDDTDAAYVPVTPSPDALALIAGAPEQPHAAVLLLDQSGSIAQTDPTGARLYSAKAFLEHLGEGNWAELAAFSSPPGALIPTPPLTLYPPFRDQSSATSYFATLDSLHGLIGGNTPLYDSIDTVSRQLRDDTTLPAGIAKDIVVFTDGDDSLCGTPANCGAQRQASIQAAKDSQVRLFTIGLSGQVDTLALGQLASETGGAFLFASTVEQLLPLYGSAGKLLSGSLPTYRLRWTIRSDATGAFKPGGTLLGRVQVKVPSSTFEVPFVVGIP